MGRVRKKRMKFSARNSHKGRVRTTSENARAKRRRRDRLTFREFFEYPKRGSLYLNLSWEREFLSWVWVRYNHPLRYLPWQWISGVRAFPVNFNVSGSVGSVPQCPSFRIVPFPFPSLTFRSALRQFDYRLTYPVGTLLFPDFLIPLSLSAFTLSFWIQIPT